MPWDASLLVEEEEPKSGWDPSLLVEEPEPPSKLEQANAGLAELGQVLREREREQGPTIGPSERSPLQRLRTSALGRSIAGPTREERAAMVAQQPSVADIGKTLLRFTTAPPQITEPIQEATEPLISRLPPVPAGITRGVRDVGIGVLGSLPAGALMPARFIAAPFAADYASTIPEQFQSIRESETPEQAAQALTTTTLGGGAIGAGALIGNRRIPPGSISINQAAAPGGYNIEPSMRVGQPLPISLGVPEIRVSPEIARLPPSGLSMAGEPARVTPQTGEVSATPEMLELLPKPVETPFAINELIRSPIERGEALRQVEELGQQIRRREDFEKARSQQVSEAQTQAEGTILHPDKPLTDNQINLIQDSLRRAVLENQIPGERRGIISGSPLEKWADKVINTDFRGRTSLNPIDILGQQIPAWAIKGAAVLERGVRTFTEWSKEMVSQFGDDIKPHLKNIYGQSLHLKGEEKRANQVSQAAEVHGPLRLQQAEVPQEVSAQVSGEGVPAPTGPAVQGKVLLTPEVTVSPGEGRGIVPTGSGRLMEIIDNAIGKPKEVGPAVKTDTSTPFPDFQEHGASKKIFSQPFGFENLPVIGALFGGTRRLKGHANESLSTYWAERNIGKAIPSVFGNEYSWLDKAFTKKDGQITNITPAKEGGSRYISDVFEALQKDPDAYVLNAEQRKAFDAMQELEKDFTRLEDKYKIGKNADNEASDFTEGLYDTDAPKQKGPYFSRIVVSRPGGVTSGLTRGSSVGSKAFFEKPRLFETEAEGWAKGYKYEPSIVNRLATRAERLYKRIADKRLAEDTSLEGVGRKEVESQLKASFAEELASGEMTEKKISQMADSIEARGRVYAPAFFNKIFPEATANQLNKAFPKSQSSLMRAAASINNASKGLQLGLDLGVNFIQGQGLLATHPSIWGKATFNSLAAMFRKEHFPNYVRSNLEPVRELAQLGSGVGRLEEYMSGLGEKELLSRIPGVKAVTAPFARQFQTFLDVAKVEMWKASRETAPKEEWSNAAQSIESVLSSGRMEAAGVSPARSLIERVLLLAPAYYRGGLNNIANIAEKGVSGQIARRSMVAYATAGSVLFYGVAKALGMSDEDILQRMNPARSDFMLWRIKTKNHISNVGFGGFYRSLLRLMGNTAKTSLEHPENWASLSPDKNPITKWYRGHAGPVVTAVWDGFSGKDYMGQDTDIASIARRAITPITLQSAKGRPGQPTPTAAESAGSFVGLQSFPSTSKTELNKLHSEWLSNNKDPKVKADYERNKGRPRVQSKYAVLNTALIDKDQAGAVKAIKDLQAEGVKRSDIYERMSPYAGSGEAQKPLFHESATLESAFKKSLTPEQLKLYEQARADRKEQWKLFLKAYREGK